MNTYRIQIVLAAMLLCALAGSIVLAPFNVIVSVLGIQEVIKSSGSSAKRSKKLVSILALVVIVLLIITFFELMLSYMDILFALM